MFFFLLVYYILLSENAARKGKKPVMSNTEVPKGHPVLGVVLGILGIAAALALCLFTGIIGGIIAGALGLSAFLLGMSARKNSKGYGAVAAGALALVLAVLLTVGSVRTFTEIQQEASNYADEAPLFVRSLSKPYLGIVGMIFSMPKDEGTVQELVDQFHLIEDRLQASRATKEQKPSAAPEAAR